MTQFEMTTSTEPAGSGTSSITPLRKIRVRRACSGCVVAGEREHLVRHVEPEHAAGRADALRREDDVDAAAGAEVEHGLAFVQLRHRGRVAAAE